MAAAGGRTDYKMAAAAYLSSQPLSQNLHSQSEALQEKSPTWQTPAKVFTDATVPTGTTPRTPVLEFSDMHTYQNGSSGGL